MANPVLEKQFGEPSASDAALAATPSPRSTTEAQMTIGSVMGATFFLLLLVSGGAIFGWVNAATVWRWWWAIAIGLIVLVILTVDRKSVV